MQKIYLALLIFISSHIALAQGENCSGAVVLTNGACVAGTPGTSQNIVGCVGNADDDSWYRFTATSTSHSLTVIGSGGYDAVLQFFSGTCGSLISGVCVDNTFTNGTESTVVTGLTVGATYYVRVYHYFAGSAGAFTMCLNNPPAPPANDNCVNAINLTANAVCVQTAGTSFGATAQSLYPSCAGTANDDVWYSFTATNYTQTIQVAGSAAMDPVIELFSGTCGSFTSLSCTDNTFSGGTETVTAGGLTPGATYFFRVYDYYSGSGSTFSVCVSGNSIIAGSQPNDEPCNAILLPPVTADCNYSTFSNVGATLSSVASPTNCLGGTGGFTVTTKDVWFAIIVPASGNLCITPQPNLTPSTSVIDDGVMALYSGSCGSLTQIACSDDADGAPVGNFNYPGTANDFLPYINQTGLTPGTTVYLRYWGWGSEAGTFGICVQAPTNDLCANALYICDINGYSASTSPAYTPDRPGTGAGQMYGNNETAAGVNQPDGTNTGGIFGYYPPSNIAGPYSSPAIDVNIENNSWIRFTAASPTISLRVNVYDCWENTPGNQGVQMQIFSGTNCTNFSPVSTFQEGIGTYTLSATALTVGNTYYLMVDGWGGNICNYNIQAIAGVAFPEITAAPGSICPGQSAILTAPSGATGYTWEPTGQNTQTISVSPGTTMTYTCYVGGVCGYKQTLTKTVTMLAVPSVSINSNNPITTCGTQTITLTGGGASTYSWSTGSTAGSFTAAPSGSQSYSVIGTAANGCTNSAVTNVTVNPLPAIVPGATGSNTICTGGSASLTVSGASTYTWSPTATLSSSTGTAVTATPTIGTNYTIIGTAANGCTNSATYSVTVNPRPTVSSTTTGSVICNGNSTTVNGTGASTYTWTGGITDGVAFTPTATATYTVTGTNAATGCTNTAVRTITVTPTPTVGTTASNSVICIGNSVTLSGSGATTYTWSGGISNGVAFSPTTTTTYTVTGATSGCTNTAVRTVTVNLLPTVSSTVTNSVICNGQSTTLNGTGATTYTWSGGVTNGTPFSPSSTNTYTVSGTDVNGCVNTAVRSITVNPLPPVSSTTTGSVICNGGSTTLNGTGATTYTWSGGVSDGVAFTPTATATYTVTGTNAATGCTNTAVRTITVAPTPTVTTATSNSVICIGNSTSLTGSGATTYTWSNGVANGASFSPTATATYTVIGATGGCINTAVRTITVNPLPTVSSTASNSVICNGASTTLNGTGANTYTWTGGISNGVAFSPTTTTTYTVTGTDANGCINSSVRTVTVNAIPTSTASTTGTITCITNTVNLNSSLAGANYTWTAPGGSSISGGTANNQNAIGQGSGTYTLSVMSSAGCTYSTTLATNVNTLAPTASAGNGTLTCAVTSTVLSGGPTSGVTYNWSGPGIVGSNTIANITASVAGTYSLVTTSTINGCSSAAAAVGTLTNNLTTPTVTAGSNQTITCAAPTVTLSGSATAGSNYSWSNGAPTSTTTVSGSGTYTLTAINPSTGCSSTATVQVLPSAGTPTGNISAASNSITCANTSATVSITSGSSPISILWTGPGITGPTNTASTTVSQGNVTYTVTLTNTSSMCSQSYNVFVPLNTTPVVASASISAGSSSITCSTTSLTLSSSPTGANYSYSWTGPGIVSGGNTANPIVNLGGTYSVTITNTVNGCSGVNGTTNVAVPSNTATPTLSLSATSVTTTCGNPSATVTASSNSNPNTTYTWTAPSTGTISSTSVSNPSIGGSGVFTVAITNTVSGCPSAPMTVTVTADANIPTFTLSANSVVANCTTPAPGVTISTSPGLTYSWSPAPNSGGNTATPTFTAAGTYTCLVTNPTNSCSTNVPMVSVSVDQMAPTATATPASSVTCTNTLVAISSTVTPATNVTVNWTGPNVVSGNTTLSPSIGAGGNYVVAMTNTVNGCTNSYTVNVSTNTTVPAVNLAANSLTTTCANPTATFNASSSAPSATYSWTSPAGGSLSSNTSNSPTASGSGVFTVSVTDPVNGCVSASTTATLTADANIPTFSLPANTATITCAVSNPSVSLTSTVSGVTYSWSPAPASGATVASPTFTAPGSYTCLITNPTNSCSTSGAVVTVTQDLAVPTATAAASSSITCSTTSLSITSAVTPSNNVTYNWTGPNVLSGAASLTPVIGTGGDYVIAMTNTVNGCTNTYTVTVSSNTISPTMNVAANAYTTTCSTPGVTLSATSSSDPATTYSWTAPSTGTISNSTINNPVVGGSGVFTVAVANTVNGCVSAIETVTITPDQNIPTFSLQATSVIINCSVPSPSVSLTSTVSGVTYSWSPVPASGATTASPTFTAAGDYTCTITNPANNCSTNAAQFSVTTDTTIPVASITPNASVTCNSSTVTLTSTVTPSSATYTWSGTGISGGLNGTSVTTTAGSYTLTVTDPVNGCSVTATAAVGTDTATPTLTIASTSTVITCSITSSTLTAGSLSGTPTWVIPGGGTASNPVTAIVPGDYIATVTDSNNGCVTSQTISVSGNTTLPDANAGAATVVPCGSPSVTLMGSSTSTDVVTYSWAGPTAGSISSATNIANPTVTSAGVYTLTVTNSSTGCSQTATVSVTQNNVTASFTADPTSGEAPLPVTFTNTSVGATSYSWSFGNGSTSTTQDPNTVYNDAGTYTVILTAINGGCSDTAVRIITVEDGFTIEIPNVFTPNGDGVNEAFHIKTSGVKSAEGYIYNRWGQILYSWDVLNISWDGKASNGENCPDGTYYYLIKVIDKKDKEHLAPGFVLIAR